MTKFWLFIDNLNLGEFDPPQGPGPFQYKYYCLHCGRVFATRLSADGVWLFTASVCLDCATPSADWQYFRTPFEVSEDFEPTPILAMEFLYNYAHFSKELAND